MYVVINFFKKVLLFSKKYWILLEIKIIYFIDMIVFMF